MTPFRLAHSTIPVRLTDRSCQLDQASGHPGEEVFLEREPGNPHDPNAFRHQYARLAEGYLAGTDPLPETSGTPTERLVHFLDLVGRAARPAPEQIGLGTRFDLSSPHVSGSALWHDGHLCHLSALGSESSVQ